MTILYRLIAAAAIMAAIYAAGIVHGLRIEQHHGEAIIQQQADAALKQVQIGAAKTAALQGAAHKLNEEKDAQIRTIDSRLRTALERLRQRPERPASSADMPHTAAACTGASGADLARLDAEFLVRYDALALKYQAWLAQCKTQYNQAREALTAGQ